MPPDYSIYPQFKRGIGFLTRGCIRQCPWCLVPHKEGKIRPAADWEEVRRPDSREIVFLDNNVLASDFGLEQIDRMGGKPTWVDFNQSLDARLSILETAKLLARLHWIRFIRMVLRYQGYAPGGGAGRSLSPRGRRGSPSRTFLEFLWRSKLFCIRQQYSRICSRHCKSGGSIDFPPLPTHIFMEIEVAFVLARPFQ